MTAKKKSEQYLDPIFVSQTSWFYPGKSTVQLIHEVRDADGEYIQTNTINIPWPKLLLALKRSREWHSRKRRITPHAKKKGKANG